MTARWTGRRTGSTPDCIRPADRFARLERIPELDAACYSVNYSAIHVICNLILKLVFAFLCQTQLLYAL